MFYFIFISAHHLILDVFRFTMLHRQQKQMILLWWNRICCQLESDTKRAPGKHPGLFQISVSRLFRARFPIDIYPGQEEQPLLWFWETISLFFSATVSRQSLHWNGDNLLLSLAIKNISLCFKNSHFSINFGIFSIRKIIAVLPTKSPPNLPAVWTGWG